MNARPNKKKEKQCPECKSTYIRKNGNKKSKYSFQCVSPTKIKNFFQSG